MGGMDSVMAACGFHITIGKDHPLHLLPMSALSMRGYQADGVEAISKTLFECGGAVLGDEMGLGKTLQALITTRVLNCKRTLIVCPASVRETWREEIAKWLKKTALVLGPASEYAGEWNYIAKAEYLVCSYNMAEEVITAVSGYGMIDMVILDEAQLLRGRQSKRSKTMSQYLGMVKYRLAVTGTPIWDRLRDAWKLLDIILPNKFGNQKEFDEAYCGAVENTHGGLDNTGATRLEEFKTRINCYMVRREKKDVASEMPKFTRQVIWLENNESATNAYKAWILLRASRTFAEAQKATLDAKVEKTVQLALEAGKFLVATWLKSDAEKIQRLINAAGGNASLITGDLSHKKRHEVIEYARSSQGGIVATIDSIAVGLNLQYVANVGIMHTVDPEPHKTAQTEARLNRLGQTLPVQWYWLACRESIDEVIVEKVLSKIDAIKGAIEQSDAVSSISESLKDSEADMKSLYNMLPEDEEEAPT